MGFRDRERKSHDRQPWNLTKHSGQSSCRTALQVTHQIGVRCMPCTAEESGNVWELLVATIDGRQCLEFINVTYLSAIEVTILTT